jgi:predicted nucleotidyltransferase
MRTASRFPGPVEVLFGKYRRQILGLLLLHPDESFYVREIARLTGTPAGSLHRELRTLTAADLLTRTQSGNQVRYQAHRACPIFEDLAAIFRKTTGLADVLREALVPLAHDIDLAFVFGSVAQGRDREVSDVDVMVVGEAPFPSVVEALSRTRESLRREVNPVVMAAAAFRSKHRAGDRFVTRIVREPKLFLLGGARELGELVEDRPTQGASAGRGGNQATPRRGAKKSGRRGRHGGQP